MRNSGGRPLPDIFRADTTTAVEAFQRWHGLAVDGIVGDRTWAAGLDSAGNTLEGRVGLQHVRESTST